MSFKEKLEKIEISLSYDDILIKPGDSSILPSEVDLSISLNEKIRLEIPIFSASMDTVTGYEMSRSMILCGGCGPLHKNESLESNIESLRKLKEEFGDSKPIAVSVGTGNSRESIQALVEAGANVVIVDSAHGHSKNVGDLVEYISKTYPSVYLIAGNVVTEEGAKFLADKGANAIKVGIGVGSICTTRKVTGIGRGQVSSIAEVADFCKSRGLLVIADGGMKSSDEIVKAISVGAKTVMLGYMLAGCDECPGQVIQIDNEKYKRYRGMGSLGAMKIGSSDRYNKNALSNCKWVPEGIESYVKVRGPVKDVLYNIEWSMKSAFGYIGALNLEEVKKKAQIVRITKSTLERSNIHSIDRVIS